MIEVEKKFRPSDMALRSLLREAELTETLKFTDSYYDREGWPLSTKDTHLRKRDGVWELKVPARDDMGGTRSRAADQYHEYTDPAEIAAKLELPDGDLAEAVEQAGYFPYATITTVRKSYRKEGFTIVVDTMDYGYDIVEIELTVKRDDQVDAAVRRIMQFAASCGLEPNGVDGKVIEYMRRNDPGHLNALIESGVV